MSDAPIVLRRPRRAAAGHNFWIGITIGLLLCGITIAYGPIGLSVLASVVGFLLVTVFGLALAEVISKLRFRRDAGPARIELAPGELTVVSDYPERYRRSFRREDIVGVEVMRSTEQRSILKLIGPDEERSDAPMPWPRNQIGPDHFTWRSHNRDWDPDLPDTIGGVAAAQVARGLREWIAGAPFEVVRGTIGGHA